MPNTPQQQRRRDRVETLLRLATPVLDLVLTTGERVSRLVAPGDDDHYAIPPAGERLELEAIRGVEPHVRQPEA
jgi:hypothetical protein